MAEGPGVATLFTGGVPAFTTPLILDGMEEDTVFLIAECRQNKHTPSRIPGIPMQTHKTKMTPTTASAMAATAGRERDLPITQIF